MSAAVLSFREVSDRAAGAVRGQALAGKIRHGHLQPGDFADAIAAAQAEGPAFLDALIAEVDKRLSANP